MARWQEFYKLVLSDQMIWQVQIHHQLAIDDKIFFQSESSIVSIIQDSLVSRGPAGIVIATTSICLCRFLLNIEYHSFPAEEIRYLKCGFLINEVRVASYNFWVTIYCKSYELFFTYKFRGTNCTICDSKIDYLPYQPSISMTRTKSGISSLQFLSNACHEWVLLRWIITSFFHV